MAESSTLRQEESHFLQLFRIVLDNIIAMKNVTDSDISQSVQILIESFKPFQTFHEIDFSQWKNICAFLYRYASHGAGFARYRILKAIPDCEVMRNALKKSNLKVIFLGSGAGNDMVGFCSALSELLIPKSLKLTLVDKYKEWFLCNDLIKEFIENGNFGKVSEVFQNTDVDVELFKIQVNLPGNPNSDQEYFKFLREADVIIMSKFLSSLDRSNYQECSKSIIQSLAENVKKDAVILVNDFVFEEWWSGFRKEYEYNVNEEDNYQSTAFAGPRFNSHDNIQSKLPTYVMVKT